MIILSINLLILSACLLILGLLKPGWILFWMDKPGRMPIMALAGALFMIAVVMFGEANRQNENEKARQMKQVEKSKENADIPVPVAVD
jgi:hypothetical protein